MSDVTVWYLHMERPEDLLAKPQPEGIQLAEARVPQYQFNRFLYELVGAAWGWTDKNSWTDEQWRDYVVDEHLRTWVAWCDGSPAGYFELYRHADAAVEINYFGLAKPFIGRGFGGWLLSEAIDKAWSCPAQRVIVNTCSLDHPSALANYKARGMTLYQTETRSG